MKRIILTATTVLTIMSAISCSDRQSDLEQQNLKGDVVLVTDTIWDAVEKFGEIQKKFMTGITKMTFNEDGQITSITEYDSKGEIIGKKVQVWQDKDQLSETYSYNTDGFIKDRYIYNYDGDRIRTVTGHFTTGRDTLETQTYRYDGKKISRIEGVKGDSISSVDYSYLDDNGSYKLITKDYHGNTNEILQYFDSDRRTVKSVINKVEYLYEYDSNGNYSKVTYLQNEISYHYTKFDDKDNWTERVITTRINNSQQSLTIDSRHIEYR